MTTKVESSHGQLQFITPDRNRLLPEVFSKTGSRINHPVIGGSIIKEVEVEDWGMKPDNEDIGATVRIVSDASSIVAINGAPHVEFRTADLKTVSIFDVKKNGAVEFDILPPDRARIKASGLKFTHTE